MSTPTPRTDARLMVVTDNDTCKIKVLETVRAPFVRILEREVNALTAERDQLRAEVERLRAGIEECLHTNAHLADGEDCTLIELKRCFRDSRVERSDAEQVDAWASWASTCMHHNDAERGRCGRVCPVCITAERDLLRACLRDLVDEQNGAPLELRRKQWQTAMDEALAALDATEGAK